MTARTSGRTNSRRILVGFGLPEALRDVLQGVTDFAKRNGRDWRVLCVDGNELLPNLADHRADGVMTMLGPRSARLIGRLGQCGTPVVNMLHNLHPRLPSVLSDDVAIGRAGAEYFLGRGFGTFAFAGIDTEWSRGREEGFRAAGRGAGLADPLIIKPLKVADFRFVSRMHAVSALRRWLRKLPRRVAVMAPCDFVARSLLDAAQSEGIDVPGEAAILGVDNFHTICELSPVPLSSIAQDFCGMGYAAARQLDAAMENKKFRADGPVLMAPGRLVVRTSTDVLAFSDPVVVATLNLIHQHAAAGISMKQILREVPLSRKWLDQRFKTVVGHTPSREIRRCRMEQVRQLLIETDMPLRQIAVRCQFSCTENLIRCFRASFKVPPQTYRVQQRQGVVTR